MSTFSRGFKNVPSPLPTEKQKSLVEDICLTLGKQFPREETKWAYSKFIDENMDEYKVEKAWSGLLDFDDYNIYLND